MNLEMAKGFKSGGRQKGSKNKPKELMATSIERAAAAGNARAHAKVLPVLKLTPLEVMLANMEWAWNEATDMQKRIAEYANCSPETKLEAFREMVWLRDRAQSYARMAAPYVHPKLQAVALVQEDIPQVEVDPLREHIKEFAEHFRIKLADIRGQDDCTPGLRERGKTEHPNKPNSRN